MSLFSVGLIGLGIGFMTGVPVGVILTFMGLWHIAQRFHAARRSRAQTV